MGVFVDLFYPLDGVVGVDFRRPQVGMTQQFLNALDLRPPVQQVGGEGVAQHVRTAFAMHAECPECNILFE